MPSWAAGPFVCLTRTESELSVVCGEFAVPAAIQSTGGFRALRVEGVLEFSAVGVLASLAQPLSAAGISLFAISTYDTDYILVQGADLGKAIGALTAAGHLVG